MMKFVGIPQGGSLTSPHFFSVRALLPDVPRCVIVSDGLRAARRIALA